MAKKNFPRLKNAPVVEALIDIQVELESPPSIEKLKSLIPQTIHSTFPHCEERKVFEAGFGQTAKGKFHQNFTDLGIVGYLLRDSENKKVVQVRLDGFGFSHLQPYSDFESFQNETKVLWSQYKEFAKVGTVTRVALLFINIIDLEKEASTLGDFEKVLKTLPKKPLNTDAEAYSFYSQYQLRKTSEVLTAIVTQHDVKNVRSGSSGFKFQIDASKAFEQNPTEEELWDTVEKLRNFKNEIFFGSLDKKQINKYKGKLGDRDV
jgi:uncharacterized protein (TIGR04255 family)